jgi:hypothetical protein
MICLVFLNPRGGTNSRNTFVQALIYPSRGIENIQLCWIRKTAGP